MEEADLKKLISIKTQLSELRQIKQNQIHSLKTEIEHILEMEQNLTNLISSNSFTTAASVLTSEMDAVTAAKQSPKYGDNLKYTQKIFSQDKEQLLVVLQFKQNQVFIRFPHPEITQITQEDYINDFVKPSLVKLKKIEESLTPSLSKSFYGENEFIDSVTLKNIENFESFEYIVEKIKFFINSR